MIKGVQIFAVSTAEMMRPIATDLTVTYFIKFQTVPSIIVAHDSVICLQLTNT